jgi:hypothetical protein
MNTPGYPEKEPAERPPIANDPAPAQEFGRGVATGDKRQSPANKLRATMAVRNRITDKAEIAQLNRQLDLGLRRYLRQHLRQLKKDHTKCSRPRHRPPARSRP